MMTRAEAMRRIRLVVHARGPVRLPGCDLNSVAIESRGWDARVSVVARKLAAARAVLKMSHVTERRKRCAERIVATLTPR